MTRLIPNRASVPAADLVAKIVTTNAEASTVPAVPRGAFSVTWQDRAMSPRVHPGNVLHFRADLLPAGGDGVLVQDHVGGLHLRQYVPGANGRWLGRASDGDFVDLDSTVDRVRVVAVLTGIEGRWANVHHNTIRAEARHA